MTTLLRKRLTQEESRDAALDAARTLLVEDGPQAVTLKAVAARIGRTHANLLHHFGSAGGLQRALIERMADTITAKIGAEILCQRGAAEPSTRAVVDLTFDAFEREGAGKLASWMILTGNLDALDPVLAAIHRLVDHIGDDGHSDRPIHEETLQLVLMALGDALLGAPMAKALGLPREAAREIAARGLAGARGLRG